MVGGIVVVGGGHAGAALVASLRSEGYEGPIRLVSAEAEIPYQRPPLSKAFLKDTSAEILPIKPEAWYAANRVDVDLAVTATAIDRQARTIHLSDGRTVPYEGLALALGARVRKPAVPGADLDGILYLRSTADARILREALVAAKDVVVVGGGFIGLEVAATAALLGKAVTVLEAAPRLMGRAVAPEVSTIMLARHRAAGIDVRLNTSLVSFEGERGRVMAVRGSGEGSAIPADLVLVGIGVIPNVEIAEAAGLAVDGGLLVDDHAVTSDHTIVASGDGVVFDHWQAGRRLRVESVQNATDQSRHAALALLHKPDPYRSVPWFWSDQGPTKLQMVGLSHGADRTVVRGNPQEGRFSVFHYAGDRLVAIDSVDRPADHMIGRRLLAAGTPLPPELAADESVDLKALAGPTR
ncbi:NAD(P)/FAD-dependent oxidoreductase [Chthonobacter rhizosphaerae]|uniref:NAD(P)/FAD-dependent oxidoreductase n=1 Tax=Chthonobacter rhizosphaerae TaxID=2735553 RepID=UPI0015EE6195|nr:FAD-dependent oxidoreductase [Chthonobacter rhizosphaerae]